MSKLKRFMMLALFVAFLVILSACGDEATSTDGEEDGFEITLTYSDHDPPGGMRTEFIENVWIPEIEKQTNNQVTVNANFGGSLLSSQEVLEGASDGVTDMAMIFPDFYPERLFTYQIYKLFPEAPEKWENISTIFQESFEELPKLNEELEAVNQKPLLVTVGLPTAFGASYELEGIGDIVGKDWRASSRWHLESLEHIGANPVSVPWEDVYMSLETGVIDGVMTNYDGFHMMKFYEGAPEVIVGTQLWWATPFIHTINIDTWDGLPEDIQNGILKATEIAQEKFGDVYADELQSTIEEQEAAGVNVKMADDEDVAYFTDEELLNNLRNTWMDEATENHGIEDSEEYVNKMLEIMERGLEKE